jgi:ectonucleotide pyrophosphatase/phosphodiesterase family protein 5
VTTFEWQLESHEFRFGNHGYDPVHRSMHGLFIASGPRFRSGLKVPAFSNLHVYELICRVLNLRPAPNDGDASVTASFLR